MGNQADVTCRISLVGYNKKDADKDRWEIKSIEVTRERERERERERAVRLSYLISAKSTRYVLKEFNYLIFTEKKKSKKEPKSALFLFKALPMGPHIFISLPLSFFRRLYKNKPLMGSRASAL